MSYVWHLSCTICGQPFRVEEFPNMYVIYVGSRAVRDCPVCGMNLDEQYLAVVKGKAEGDEVEG